MNIEYGYRVVRLFVLNTSGMAITWRDVPSQWRCLLKACFMFGCDDNVQDQTRTHLVSQELGDFILHYSIGWRYIFLVEHSPCFPVPNLRMNHPSRANTRSQIHHSRLIDKRHFTLSQPYRGWYLVTVHCCIDTYSYYDAFMLLNWRSASPTRT
jgi:hypothetical protein